MLRWIAGILLLIVAAVALAVQQLDNDLLAPWVPRPGESDLRGWEWHWLDALANAQLVALTSLATP